MSLEVTTPTVTVNDVLSACRALYNHPDPAVQDQANKWLTNFQNSSIPSSNPSSPWIICNQILLQDSGDVSDEAKFFAANTLRNKVLIHMQDLVEPSHKLGFRSSLVDHLKKNKNAPSFIRVRLTLTMASLCIHLMGTQLWTTALGDLADLFATNLETAPLFVEILEFIAQEAKSVKLVISTPARNTALAILKPFGPTVLNLLMDYLTKSGSNRNLQEAVFKCFESWARWIPDSLVTDNNYDALFQHPLINATFQALTVEDLVDKSIDCIAELIHIPFQVNMSSASVRVLFPKLLELVPLLDKAADEEDDKRARNLCNLFVDMGETYLEIIAGNSELSKAALEVLLRCTGYPDSRISASTFRFWYMLSEHVQRCPAEVKVIKTSFLAPYYSRLIEQLRIIMQYPQDLDSWDEERRNASRDFRYSAAESLEDATSVVGIDACLEQIYLALVRETKRFQADASQWHALESCLYCIRCIARNVSNNEKQILPKIFEMLPMISNNHHLRYTATLIVGRYGAWINEHPSCLPEMLNFVIAGLNDKIVAPSAALALRHVCTDASKHISVAFLPQIFNIYTNCRSLPIEEQREITTAICAAISSLELVTFKNALQALAEPIAKDLTQALNLIQSNPSQKEEIGNHVHICLDRLSEIVKQLNPELNDDPSIVKAGVAQLFQDIWSKLILTLNIYKNDERKMEKLTRCWKYCIKLMGRDFLPVLNSLAQTIVSVFAESPLPPFIYIISTCCNSFGQIPDYERLFIECTVVFNNHCLNLFSNPKNFIEYPELMEDYYSYLAELTRKCPNVIFNPACNLDALFKISLGGITVPHTGSVSALYEFLEFLFTSVSQTPRAHHKRQGAPAAPQHQAALASVLNNHGEELVLILIHAVNGSVQFKMMKFIANLFLALIDLLGHKLKPVIEKAITSIPETHLPSKSEFVESLFSSTNPADIKDLVQKFAAACKGRPS